MSDQREPIDWPDDPAVAAALAALLAGEADATQRAAAERWLAADPARGAAFERLRSTLERAAARDTPIDIDAALRRVHERLDAMPDAAPDEPRRSRMPSVWLPAAAAVVLLLAGGLVWRMLRDDASVVAVQDAVHWTAVGETRTLELPDGSTLLLGPSSRVSIREDFGAAARTVQLDGLARFAVVHDANRPFTVIAGDVIVRDLGTVFTVDAVAQEVRVAVEEGVVEVTAPAHAPVVLNAGDRAVAAVAGVLPERGVPLEPDLAWTDGRIVFDDAPLPRVAAELARWYGVRLHIADERLRSRTVTAVFAGEPLQQVLEILALALDARVRHADGNVFLETAPPGS